MSYVPVYANGVIPRRRLAPSLSGLGADVQPTAIPAYIQSIINDIESKYPLNTAAVQALVDAISAKLSAEMKKQAVEQAAVSAGLGVASIVCYFIPVIGWVIDVIIVVVQAIIKVTSSHFNDLSNALKNDTINYLRTLAATYEAKLREYQGQCVEMEAPAAFQLATSGATLQGLGDWRKNLARDFRRATLMPMIMNEPVAHLTHVTIQSTGSLLLKVPIPVSQTAVTAMMSLDQRAYDHVTDTAKKVNDLAEAVTGEAQLEKTKEACYKARAVAEIEFKRQFDIAMANSDAPPFRAALRNGLAAIFRTDPSINSVMSQIVAAAAGGTSANMQFNVQEPSKGLKAIPMVATAVAAGAALLLLKK